MYVLMIIIIIAIIKSHYYYFNLKMNNHNPSTSAHSCSNTYEFQRTVLQEQCLIFSAPTAHLCHLAQTPT